MGSQALWGAEHSLGRFGASNIHPFNCPTLLPLHRSLPPLLTSITGAKNRSFGGQTTHQSATNRSPDAGVCGGWSRRGPWPLRKEDKEKNQTHTGFLDDQVVPHKDSDGGVGHQAGDILGDPQLMLPRIRLSPAPSLPSRGAGLPGTRRTPGRPCTGPASKCRGPGCRQICRS